MIYVAVEKCKKSEKIKHTLYITKLLALTFLVEAFVKLVFRAECEEMYMSQEDHTKCQ